MEKVLRRTALAKAQAVRKAMLRKGKEKSLNRVIRDNDKTNIYRAEAKDVRNAQKARREDWELGPLAPRRDVGDLQDTYGTIDARRMQGIELPREQQRKRLWNIVEGDRVVILEGRDKGKIGRVRSTSKEKDEVMVEGLNMVEVPVPKWLRETSNEPMPPVQIMEMGIPVNNVRLVHALTDPETGTTRDVIVKKIETGSVFHDKQYGGRHWTRYIAGLGVRIPWPVKEPVNEKDTEADTLRIDVESQTWAPTLLRPPMPLSVIDELRNRYSVFRDRHDEDFVAQRQAEDEAAIAKKKADKLLMETPVKQLNRVKRMENRAKGQPTLTEEMMEKIGEVMARNKSIATSS
ncbi:MAG: hypothetical protein M4579_001218 [Chaenotheca gracillima]|nr:MAG: hypothetical protein M4579_001218 [Chaenotheca gracillima]